MKLLSLGKSVTKINKSDKAGKGYLSAIMYLAPYTLSGVNLCPKASPGCVKSCLFTSGLAGIYPRINIFRIAKSKFYLKEFDKFKVQLIKEVEAFIRYCEKRKQKPCIRLNGTSDIVWEKKMPELFTLFPQVQWYDYTKIIKRLEKPLPKNYHLTFSRSEKNEQESKKALSLGFNTTVVFEKTLPKTYWGYKVIDGDKTDLRFLDKGPVIIGLKAKGKAKKDDTGFVVRG